MTLRDSVASDFERTLAEPLPFRVRSFTAEEGGKILGIGGLAYLPAGEIGAFLVLCPGAEKYPVTLHKAAKRVLREAHERGFRTVVSLADKKFRNSERWHERLGFRPVMIGRQKVFTWTRSR